MHLPGQFKRYQRPKVEDAEDAVDEESHFLKYSIVVGPNTYVYSMCTRFAYLLISPTNSDSLALFIQDLPSLRSSLRF